jgi:hypothetical protein
MTCIPRRTVLQGIAATAICSPAIVRSHRAAAALPPLPNLPASDALLLRPGDAQFAQYEPAFNARTMLTPQLRAMCKTPNAVGVVVDWCRSNNITDEFDCHRYGDENRDRRRGRVPWTAVSGHCTAGLRLSRRQLPDRRRIGAPARRRLGSRATTYCPSISSIPKANRQH